MDGKLPIRMLHDRVEAVGYQVRAVEVGDRVLHAVASERIDEGQTGLYL